MNRKIAPRKVVRHVLDRPKGERPRKRRPRQQAHLNLSSEFPAFLGLSWTEHDDGVDPSGGVAHPHADAEPVMDRVSLALVRRMTGEGS